MITLRSGCSAGLTLTSLDSGNYHASSYNTITSTTDLHADLLKPHPTFNPEFYLTTSTPTLCTQVKEVCAQLLSTPQAAAAGARKNNATKDNSAGNTPFESITNKKLKSALDDCLRCGMVSPSGPLHNTWNVCFSHRKFACV